MTELTPFFVTAPLNVNCASVLDTETIYIFDYENSFIGENDRPSKFITYMETLGGMVDIFVSPNVSYEDREQLVLQYFSSGSFMNLYTLVETMIHCLFVYKGIGYNNKRSIFTDAECQKFNQNNEEFLKQMITFYDSMFVIMLFYIGNMSKDIKVLRQRFTRQQINTEELSPNVCSLLLDTSFYEYYDKHIGKDIFYYEFLFENNLYRSMGFLDILTNKNNILLPVLMDMTNEKFLEFIREQKKES